MAYLIPENVRTAPGLPAAHKNVATALSVGLSNDAIVWYEPPFDFDQERPEFVVLDPTAGITTISVLADDVLGAVRGTLRVNAGGESDADNPLERAQLFGQRVEEAIAGRPSLKLVTVRGVAVFPALARAEAEARGLDAVLELSDCLFKDDIAKAKVDEEFLLRFLLRVHDGGCGEDLEIEQINELRGIIHPDVVVGEPPEQGALFTANEADHHGENAVKVMDRQQERLARKIGSGHRVIRGVAGSGKTLILLHRARHLARLHPNERILVTCYTRALTSSLSALLSDSPNIEVRRHHQVMGDAIRAAGLEHPAKGNTGWDRVGTVACAAAQLKRPKPYRAVLIDEAQDFMTDELRFFTTLFESDQPDEQDLLVVADNAQNIYARSFTWKAAGIVAPGRTHVMKTNYRNTREVLEFAHGFLAADPAIDMDDGDDTEGISIVPAESTERSGSPVSVTLVDDDAAQVAAVVATVKKWHNEGHNSPRSIAVLMLSETSGRIGERISDRLRSEGLDVFWVGDPDNKSAKDQIGAATAPVVMSTVHSSKGLEFSRVVVTGLQSWNLDDPDRRATASKALYVGFTRAVDELAVVATKDNVFADRFLP